MSSENGEFLNLTFEDFDQNASQGWRPLAREAQFGMAAKMIESYLNHHRGRLEAPQQSTLHFHAGQMMAFSGDELGAIPHFRKSSLDEEPEGEIVRWNAYVTATIAFIMKDRESLQKMHDEIALGQKIGGKIPNLDIVERMLERFVDAQL